MNYYIILYETEHFGYDAYEESAYSFNVSNLFKTKEQAEKHLSEDDMEYKEKEEFYWNMSANSYTEARIEEVGVAE